MRENPYQCNLCNKGCRNPVHFVVNNNVICCGSKFIGNISKTILLLVSFNTAHGRKKQDKCHVNVTDVTKILLFHVLCFRKFIGEYIENNFVISVIQYCTREKQTREMPCQCN